jgi:hypothetical protein
MKLKSLFGSAAWLALAAALAGCGDVKLQRVPPGQSIRRHVEGDSQRGVATETLPPPAGVDMPVTAGAVGTAGAVAPGQANPNFAGPATGIIGAPNQPPRVEALPPLPVAGLPERNDSIERAGEAYNRGSMLMKNGQNREAIAAFEEATQLDPSFSDAWTRLTLLYEKVGQSDKARDAFRKAKGLTSQPERIAPATPPPAPVLPPVAPQDNAPLPDPVN